MQLSGLSNPLFRKIVFHLVLHVLSEFDYSRHVKEPCHHLLPHIAATLPPVGPCLGLSNY